VGCWRCTTTIRGLLREGLFDPGEDPVSEAAAVNLDAVARVAVDAFVARIGRLSDERMRQICGALAVAVGCD
jgi:mRNA interferase MazF